MRVGIQSFLTLAVVFVLTVSADAQHRFKPFSVNDTLPLAPKVAGENSRQYLHLGPELLDRSNVSAGDVIVFEHEGVEYDFTIKKVVSYMPNTYTYVANSGLRYFYYTVGGGIVNGAIHIPELDYEAVVHHDSALKMSYLQEHTHRDELSCGFHLVKENIIDQVDAHINSGNVHRVSDLAKKMQSVEQETTIKLMIVYASGALNWMLTYGSVDNVINQSMALSQEALDVSDTKVKIQLAHVAHVNHQEVGAGGSVLLNQLRIKGDGIMDEVHSWRNTFEADIVSLFAFLSDVGGVGYLPSTSAGDDRLGFNVNRVQQMANTYTLIHEIGHNMGNMHSRNQASAAAGPNGGVFPYSTGWRWIGDDGASYASVMTYESSPLDGVASRRTPHFSNPQISFAGVPTGTSSFTDPFGPADNARSMREMREVIAAYRPRDPDSGLPRVTSVSPAWGARGTSVSIVFRGANINSIARFSWNCGFQNVTGTINSPTQITVDATIPFNANPGKCDVIFWTGNVNASTSTAAVFTITDFPITTPTVSTESVTNVGPSQAIITGTVRFDGGEPVAERGVCVSTSPNPTLEDICISAGTGEGSFVAEFEGLTPATAYNTRAYAINLAGTAYGEQRNFSTSVPILNKAPTIDGISDVTVTAKEAFEQVVPLTGITFGGDDNEQGLSVMAVSSNPDLFLVEVLYESPKPTGTLKIRGDCKKTGTATVKVTVKDAGGIAFGGVDSTVVQFAVQILMGTNLESEAEMVTEYQLFQNYPNPFNPTTQISFSLPVDSDVELAVFDLMGRRVMELIDAKSKAGRHTVTFDAKSLPSGVYMYVIRAGEWTASNKMTLIK